MKTWRPPSPLSTRDTSGTAFSLPIWLLEKMLKAHVTQCTGDVPPRTHNLMRLCELTNLSPADRDRTFLLELGVYQLEGRYPDTGTTGLDPDFVHTELDRTREFLEWLKNQL